MESENKRAKSNSKHSLQRYLIPITIILSILISGAIGYTACQIAVNNSVSDSTEINIMNNQMTEARNESIKVIEAEIPKIINNLEKYNQDINLIDENINWVKNSLAPLRDSAGVFNTVISVIGGINTFTKIPAIDKYSIKIEIAKIKLGEVDNTLVRLENLTIIQQEISDSNQKIKLLFEEYQKEKNIEHLLLIEEELNSNLIYQIEDFRNLTIEAHEVVELSSSILITVNQAKFIIDFVQETGKNTLDVVQFWKDDEQIAKIEANIKEDLEKDLATSKEKLKNLPNELSQQSKDSITSINKVQKELQTIKIAQMIISE